MSIHDVSGVVGWCLGAYSEVENTYAHRLHTFLHTGSGLYNPLQQSRLVSRPHILYNFSTTLYNTLQHSTTLYSLQLYSSSTVYNLYNTPLILSGFSTFSSLVISRHARFSSLVTSAGRAAVKLQICSSHSEVCSSGRDRIPQSENIM